MRKILKKEKTGERNNKKKRCDTATTKTQQRPNFSPILGLIYSLKLSLSSTGSFFFFF
jgi:hypothetical protein